MAETIWRHHLVGTHPAPDWGPMCGHGDCQAPASARETTRWGGTGPQYDWYRCDVHCWREEQG